FIIESLGKGPLIMRIGTDHLKSVLLWSRRNDQDFAVCDILFAPGIHLCTQSLISIAMGTGIKYDGRGVGFTVKNIAINGIDNRVYCRVWEFQPHLDSLPLQDLAVIGRVYKFNLIALGLTTNNEGNGKDSECLDAKL